MDGQRESSGGCAESGPSQTQAGGSQVEGSVEDGEPSSLLTMAPLHEASERSTQTQSLQSDLDVFRDQWKREVTQPIKNSAAPDTEEENIENIPTSMEKAVSLYMAGMRLEQQGQLYEATMKYRRALQTEPAVEQSVRRILAHQRHQHQAKDNRLDNNGNPESFVVSNSNSESESESEVEEEGAAEGESVLAKLQQMSLSGCLLCQPAVPQTGRHISTLPSEVVQLILRWVVSSDVDVRSLEMVGLVSRGLYRLSRDPALWRRICRRVFGEACGEPVVQLSWREMYLSRPHLLFCGCYISRASYIRGGELNGYQDSDYRPWHMVRYYRYLRLFPDGVLMMLTTADDPAVTVGQLLWRPPHRGAAVAGHWRLKGDVVYAVLVPRCEKARQRTRPGRNRRARDKLPYDPGEQTLHLELQVQPARAGRYQLTWQSYRILTRYLNENEAVHTINLGDQFPPLTFSRVRSYSACSLAPL